VTPLPTRTEVHAKVIFRDVLGLLPRDAPQVRQGGAGAPPEGRAAGEAGPCWGSS